MSFNVYQGNVKKINVDALFTTIADLSPATTYVFQVTETDSVDESPKSNSVTLTTDGKLTIPTTKEIVSIKYSINCLGIESEGLDTSGQFGGSVPISVVIKKNTVVGSSRELEVESSYHMSGQVAALVEENKYLIIDGNRSIEIITK